MVTLVGAQRGLLRELLFLGPPQLHGMFNAAKFVQNMDQCAYGMMQRHARTGKTHCSLHLLSLQWFIAMNGALGTGRFGRTEGAFLQPLFGIT